MGLNDRARKAWRRIATPANRAGCSVFVGVAFVAVAVSAVSTVLAVGFVGASLIAYGLLFVDVDDNARRFRR